MAIKTYSKKKGNIKLSTNFNLYEFACNDGSDTVLVDEKLVTFLQKIRDKFKKAVIITSGYRTASYNAKIGGASNSYHVKGQATDIYINGVTTKEIAKYAESIGVKGIGLYDKASGDFVHIDTRTSKYFWNQINSREVSVNTHGGSTDSKKDSAYTTFVKEVQKATGANVDGIAASETLSKTVTISMNKNSQHKVVKAVQKYLILLGYSCGKCGADGIYGEDTKKAVKAYQKANGCVVDGVIDAQNKTWKKLLKLA